jgi:hypothetical protein
MYKYENLYYVFLCVCMYVYIKRMEGAHGCCSYNKEFKGKSRLGCFSDASYQFSFALLLIKNQMVAIWKRLYRTDDALEI